MSGTLYVCATPIGNLEDVSVRLLKTLRRVDLIACEDTRHSVKLLNRYHIKKKLISYHEFSGPEREHYIIRELEAGHDIALVSDAGMPAISDPGEELVRKVIDAGLPVVVVPGPTAFVAGLVLSGFDTSTFVFMGFLPSRSRARRQTLSTLVPETRTLVFYEAPHRLLSTLRDMLDILGDRPIAVMRELTKVHEETYRGTISGALARFGEHSPRGEFVLVLGPTAREPEIKSVEEVAEEVLCLIAEGMDKKEALKMKASQYGMKKSDLYRFITSRQGSDGN